MYEITGQAEISALISRTEASRKKIAAVSDILFRLSQNDPDVKICDSLTIAARSLGTEDIPDVSGIKKFIYLSRALERIAETEERLAGIQTELNAALTELYKTNELLRTLSEHLGKESDMLSALENKIYDFLSSETGLSENEKQLLEHQIGDMTMSQVVAEKNRQLIEPWAAKNDRLISGINSIETTLIPLWRSQLSEARASCSADDIKKSFETGRLTAEKLLSFSVKEK